jgi:hypothetical protein
MKYIQELIINYQQLIKLDFNNLKIKFLNVKELGLSVHDNINRDNLHLIDMKKDQNDIKEFILKHNQYDYQDIDKGFLEAYSELTFNYLVYLHKQGSFNYKENLKIISKNPKFCYFLLYNELVKKDDELFKTLEDIIFKDPKYGLIYALDIRKPIKEFEESDFYYYLLGEDKIKYLKNCVVSNIPIKDMNNRNSEIFKFLMNNEIYKKDIDQFYSSYNYFLVHNQKLLKEIFNYNYFDELGDYVLNNHPEKYYKIYKDLKNQIFYGEYDFYKIREKAYQDPKAVLPIIKNYYEDRGEREFFEENLNDIMSKIIKDLPTLIEYLNFMYSNRFFNKFTIDFIDDNPKIVTSIIKEVNQEDLLRNFLFVYNYYVSKKDETKKVELKDNIESLISKIGSKKNKDIDNNLDKIK